MLTVDLVRGWIFFLIQFPAAANQMRRTDSQVAVRFMKRYASYAQCCHMHLGFFFFFFGTRTLHYGIVHVWPTVVSQVTVFSLIYIQMFEKSAYIHGLLCRLFVGA